MSDLDDMETLIPAGSSDSMKEDVWYESQWDESLPNLIRGGMTVCELFEGAHAVFKNVNPETFILPLKSVVVCMKLDTLEDVVYCVRNGWMANNEACSKRMAMIWDERKDNRVYLMFSVKTSKQFCAFAEMIGTVDNRGAVEGWSKPNCQGILPLTFLYIKNVPFSVINHMANKDNGQPVSNMWNSMLYSQQQGRELVMRYVKHPNLYSVLLYPPGESALPTHFNLRLPPSGSSVYSASSFGSDNNKFLDQRSAIVAHGDGRGLKSGVNRRIYDTPWRPIGAPTIGLGFTMEHKEKNRALSGLKKTTFKIFEDEEDGTEKPPTFTTPDEQTIAGFQAWQQGTAEQMAAHSAASNATYTRGSFSALRGGLRGSRGGRAQFGGLPINTDWRDVRGGERGSLGGIIRGVPFSNDLRHMQSMEYHSALPAPGFGMANTCQPSSHMPSPSFSSQSSDDDPFRDPFVRFHQARQATITPCPSNPSASPFDRSPASHYGQGDCIMPQSTFPVMDGANSDRFADTDLAIVRCSSPMKHRQSMPNIGKSPTPRLSARAPDFVPSSAKKANFSSAVHGAAQQHTPTHKTILTMQPFSPAASVRTDGSLSPDKIDAMKPAEKARYYKLMAQKMLMRADEAEIDMQLASIEHDVDRGDLAGSTTESEPCTSPTSTAYTTDPYFISPRSSEHNHELEQLTSSEREIMRSTAESQPESDCVAYRFRHRRGFGDPSSEGFTGSFDMRVTADALNIVTSPSQSTGSHLGSPQHPASSFMQRARGTVRFTESPPRLIMRSTEDCESLSSFEGGVTVNDEHSENNGSNDDDNLLQ